MNTFIKTGLLLSVTMLAACETTMQKEANIQSTEQSLMKPATLVEEQPAPPPVVTIFETLPMPGQLKINPEKEAIGKGEKLYPAAIVEKANHAARVVPNPEDFYNAMVEYPFDKGTLYQIYTATLRMTDIQLQPGEKVMGNIIMADTERWQMARGQSMEDGQIQEHIYIKPMRSGLTTTISINTDKRTYTLEVHSYKKTYMAAVKWLYPHDEIKQYQQQAALSDFQNQQTTETNVSLDSLDFAYSVKVANGDKPVWYPERVFNDGKKTFIEFPQEMLVNEAPVLFVETDGEKQLVNYRQKNDYFIVDRLFTTAQLVSGTDNPVIVQIIKKGQESRSSAWYDSQSPNPRRNRQF
jgi:type IV secretion system protein VirB9